MPWLLPSRTILDLSRHISFRDSKANIEAGTASIEEIKLAFATDTTEIGIHTNGAWVWIGGGGVPGTGLEYKIYLIDIDAGVITPYAATGAGLDLAIADAESGDTIWCPAATITGDHTIPAGVSVIGVDRNRVIFSGQIQTSNLSLLQNASVLITGTDATLHGITSPATIGEVATLINVHVMVTVTTGNAVGLYVRGGKINAKECEFYGFADVDGAGYGHGVMVDGVADAGAFTFFSYDLPSVALVNEAYSTNFVQSPEIPLLLKGGPASCAWIEETGGGGNGYIIYDLGAVYTITDMSVYYRWGGWTVIDGSLDLVNWDGIEDSWPPAADAGWHLDVAGDPAAIGGWVEPPINVSFRYLRFSNSVFPLLGGALRIGWFSLGGTTDALFGEAELRFCKIQGTDDDIYTTGKVSVYACQYTLTNTTGTIASLSGDRSVWDALTYPERHTNDIDLSLTSIHHTLGTSPFQAAAGNHTHTDLENVSDTYFYIDGALAVGTDIITWVAPRSGLLQKIKIVLKNKGSSGTTKIDIHKNGTTIFTTQANRPSVAFNDADGIGTGIPDILTVSENDVFTIQIDEVAVGASGLGIIGAIDYEDVSPAEFIWTYSGILDTESVYQLLWNRTGRTRTIIAVWLGVRNAPAGNDIIIDVLKDDVTLFTTASNKPKILDGALTGSSVVVQNNQWADGQVLRYVIEQKGSSYAGSYLSVHVVYT